MVIPSLTKNLAALRDLGILAGAIVYLAGYVVWAVFLWENNLGPRGAVDVQYFVAGIVPTVLLTVAYWTTKSIASLGESVGRRIQRLPTWPRRGADAVWLSLPLLMLMVGLNAGSRAYDPYRSPLAVIFLITIFNLFAAVHPWVVRGVVDRRRPFPLPVATRQHVSYLQMFLWAGVITWMYATELFERIPQQLGGGAPLCASLDVVPREIGPQARSFFRTVSSVKGSIDSLPLTELVSRVPIDLESWSGDGSEEVHTTSALQVWAFTDETILITNSLGQRRGGRSLELSRTRIRSIQWCESK